MTDTFIESITDSLVFFRDIEFDMIDIFLDDVFCSIVGATVYHNVFFVFIILCDDACDSVFNGFLAIVGNSDD